MSVVTERKIILADLISFGQIRIEVLFAVPFGERRDLAVQTQGGLHPQMEGTFIEYGQGTRQAKANGAGLNVRLIRIECGRASAKYFRLRLQLNMDFQPNDNFVRHEIL